MRFAPSPVHAILAGLFGLIASLGAAYDGRYLDWSMDYADEMVAEGTDRYGSETSPLFVSMLNRDPVGIFVNPKNTLTNLSSYGVRQHDRSWNAGNPLHDHELYALLYALTDYTGIPVYAEAADASIQWFFTNTQSPVTGLMAWGEHLAWDVGSEAITTQTNASKIHEMYIWDFWPRTFALAPSAVETFALGLWNHQIVSQVTGDFNRHCRYDISWVETSGNSFPRYGGNMIAAWGNTYTATSDTSLQATLLTAIDTVTSFLQSRRKAGTNAMPVGTSPKTSNTYWPSSTLLMVREIAPIVDLLPEPTRSNLLLMLSETDTVLLGLAHDIGPGGQGFVDNAYASTLAPYTSNEHNAYTSYWSPGYGYSTAADLAVLMLERAELPHLTTQQADDYRSLALHAADRYLTAGPPTGSVMVPGAYANPILLLIEAYYQTGSTTYLERAKAFADEAGPKFITGNSPLPRVTSIHDHYETITGGDDLMLAFFELHLATLSAEGPGGALAFTQPGYEVMEDNGTVTLSVSRNGSSTGTVSVDWATTEGTALDGRDFSATSGTLTWANGDSTDKTLVITLLDDAVVEPDAETFTIGLNNATGGAFIHSPGATTVTITDDDFVPPPLPEVTRFNINFGESPYTGDGTAVWQTFDMSSGTGAGTTGNPLTYSAVTLVDTAGSDARGLTFSMGSSGIANGKVTLHDAVTSSDLTGNPFGWFDSSSSPQREVYTFDGAEGSTVWTYTFDGFDPSDIATFEWVARRASKSGAREITLSGGPESGAHTVLIDDQESDEYPQFASVTLTGSTRYTFTLSNTSPTNLWVSTANAVSVEVVRELTPSESWRKAWFGRITNDGDAADDFDFDKDGLVNKMERAFISDPTSGRLEGVLPTTSTVDADGNPGMEYLALTYRRMQGGTGSTGVDYKAGGLTYAVLSASSPAGPWVTADTRVVSIEDDTPDTGIQTVTVRLNVPFSAPTGHFLRLSVE